MKRIDYTGVSSEVGCRLQEVRWDKGSYRSVIQAVLAVVCVSLCESCAEIDQHFVSAWHRQITVTVTDTLTDEPAVSVELAAVRRDSILPCPSLEELAEALAGYSEDIVGYYDTSATTDDNGQLAFLYSGGFECTPVKLFSSLPNCDEVLAAIETQRKGERLCLAVEGDAGTELVELILEDGETTVGDFYTVTVVSEAYAPGSVPQLRIPKLE